MNISGNPATDGRGNVKSEDTIMEPRNRLQSRGFGHQYHSPGPGGSSRSGTIAESPMSTTGRLLSAGGFYFYGMSCQLRGTSTEWWSKSWHRTCTLVQVQHGSSPLRYAHSTTGTLQTQPMTTRPYPRPSGVFCFFVFPFSVPPSCELPPAAKHCSRRTLFLRVARHPARCPAQHGRYGLGCPNVYLSNVYLSNVYLRCARCPASPTSESTRVRHCRLAFVGRNNQQAGIPRFCGTHHARMKPESKSPPQIPTHCDAPQPFCFSWLGQSCIA